MALPVHVIGICGSLRRASFNRGILRAAAELLPADMTLEVTEIGDFPLYNGDVEASAYPEVVTRVRERIRAADAILIAMPEYNYGIPGVLKNAIDWISRPAKDTPWRGKALAIAGASTGNLGTARAQYQLRQVAVSQDLRPLNKPEIMIGSAGTRFDAEGTLIDEATRTHLASMLVALGDWARVLRGS